MRYAHFLPLVLSPSDNELATTYDFTPHMDFLDTVST